MAKLTRKKEGINKLPTTVLFWTTLTLMIIFYLEKRVSQKLAKLGGGDP